tara:strand:- start:329 stop:547 length:219 start_codon:yes stop_codon:yes gene_type:complete
MDPSLNLISIHANPLILRIVRSSIKFCGDTNFSSPRTGILTLLHAIKQRSIFVRLCLTLRRIRKLFSSNIGH